MHPRVGNHAQGVHRRTRRDRHGVARSALLVFEWNGSSRWRTKKSCSALPAAGIHNGSRLLVLPEQHLAHDHRRCGRRRRKQPKPRTASTARSCRLNLDGSIPADNPTPGSYVYSHGHPEPPRLAHRAPAASSWLCDLHTEQQRRSEHHRTRAQLWLAQRGGGVQHVERKQLLRGQQRPRTHRHVLALRRGQRPDVVQPLPPSQSGKIDLLLSVMGGFALNDKRLSELSMSEDGMSVTGETQWPASYGQRVRDVAVNPQHGCGVCWRLNGPS